MTDQATPAVLRLNVGLGPEPEREAFERYAEGLGYIVDPDTRKGREGGYWSSHTHLMWEAWKAAQAAERIRIAATIREAWHQRQALPGNRSGEYRQGLLAGLDGAVAMVLRA